MTFVVTPELYSTKNRVIALASANALSRIGGKFVVKLDKVPAESPPSMRRFEQFLVVVCSIGALTIKLDSSK